MFENQLESHTLRINSAASRPKERTTALRSGIEWANDATARLNEDEAYAISEFHRRKAAWKRDVNKDDKPRLIPEQIRLARTFRISGWLAIGIELLIATLTLFALLAYALPFWPALAVAFVIASVVTVGIAYVLHGGITALVARWDNPLASYQNLKRWFIFPSFMLMILSVLAYVAAQRMDAETLYYLEQVISAAKFTAMLAFMVLGTALLVAADLLDWSRSRAIAYERIRNLRQEVISKHREWQEELDAANHEREVAQVHSPDKPALNENGNAANARQSFASTLPLLLIGISLFSLIGCTRTSQIVKAPVREAVSYRVVIDASGIRNREALGEAGLNVLRSTPLIAKQQHVSQLSVFWFGHNGWTAEEKLSLMLPNYEQPELVKRERGELERIRPDVGELDKRRSQELLQEAETATRLKYAAEVEKALAPLTLELLVPPLGVESPCTDLNGMMSRFVGQPNSATHEIVVIVTDGRQNCRGSQNIRGVSFPSDKRVVVVVLVPGTNSDGLEDFELRSTQFSAACTQCVVVPYYRSDLDQVIINAKKHKGLTLN